MNPLALVLVATPLSAQTTALAPQQGATNVLDCVRSLRDQGGGGCVEASSVPTLGMLLPYPGEENTFGRLAVVSGGGSNEASGFLSSICGGAQNVASGVRSTVLGGTSNEALGYWATVGGGHSNTGSGELSFVGGGELNEAAGHCSTVGGGEFNIAEGAYSTVPGGRAVSAFGFGSFAAGVRASANHDGSFVWGDTAFGLKTSSAPDEFNIYAGGGTRVFSSSDGSTGVLLAPGGGSWTSVSDRNAKEGFEEVDGRSILEQLASIPISEWSYKSQGQSVRHMGPMAQDFYAAFGLGVDEKGIDTVDADGVAFAAIQGLHGLLREARAENEELRARVEELESLRGELAALREIVTTMAETDG